MALSPEDQYFVYENRLASFQGSQPVTKRRASNASSRAPKVLTWPHKKLSPSSVRASLQYGHLDASADPCSCTVCQSRLRLPTYTGEPRQCRLLPMRQSPRRMGRGRRPAGRASEACTRLRLGDGRCRRGGTWRVSQNTSSRSANDRGQEGNLCREMALRRQEGVEVQDQAGRTIVLFCWRIWQVLT